MGKSERGMVVLQIYIPKHMRDQLEQIKKQDGVSVSQQCRYSLGFWIRRVQRDPHGAWGLIGMGVRDGWRSTGGHGAQNASEKPKTALEHAIEVMEHPEQDPEPSQVTEPAKWASWSARQGNAAVKTMAAGYWGTPDPKGPADE